MYIANWQRKVTELVGVNEHYCIGGCGGGGAKCVVFSFVCLLLFDVCVVCVCVFHLKRAFFFLPKRLLFVICCVWMPFDSSFSGELPADCVNNQFAIIEMVCVVLCWVVSLCCGQGLILFSRTTFGLNYENFWFFFGLFQEKTNWEMDRDKEKIEI